MSVPQAIWKINFKYHSGLYVPETYCALNQQNDEGELFLRAH